MMAVISGAVMNKLATLVAIVGLIGMPAFAADMATKMPMKAPPVAPAPIYNWTGWYVGGTVGGAWGKL
jgi:outer membrane immunogenic protein